MNPRAYNDDNPTKDFALRSLELMLARDITQQKEQCEIFFEPEKLTEI